MGKLKVSTFPLGASLIMAIALGAACSLPEPPLSDNGIPAQYVDKHMPEDWWGDASIIEEGGQIYLGKQAANVNCSKCHGMTGNGTGPSAHGFSTNPRQLWAWHNADASADPYLYWFITNGRGDMPPWGVILSDNQRWDLVNYVRQFAAKK